MGGHSFAVMSTSFRPRQRRLSTVRARATAGLVVVMSLTGGVATAAPTPGSRIPTGQTVTRAAPPPESTTASAALTAARSLADGTPGTAIISAGLAAELGYTPTVDRGLAAKATGDCSSPVPLPARFEPACRVHDLGYDLLRLAHRSGSEIPHGLRADLDSALAEQMRRSCDDRMPCRVMARVAHIAVGANTVRQGNGAPVEESLPW